MSESRKRDDFDLNTDITPANKVRRKGGKDVRNPGGNQESQSGKQGEKIEKDKPGKQGEKIEKEKPEKKVESKVKTQKEKPKLSSESDMETEDSDTESESEEDLESESEGEDEAEESEESEPEEEPGSESEEKSKNQAPIVFELSLPGKKKKRKKSDESDVESLSEILGNSWNEDRISRNRQLKKIEKSDPDLHASLISVYNHIDQNYPNITEMMKENLILEDKAELYELYENFATLDPSSGDYLEMKVILNKKFKNAKARYKREGLLTEEYKTALKEKREQVQGNIYNNLTLENQILSLYCSDRIKSFIYQEYLRFKDMRDDEEKIKTDLWLNKIVKLPFDMIISLNISDKEKFLFECKARLDSKLYGLQQVKEQLLIFLNARIQNPLVRESNLGLIGEPGVGKTRIATLVSECLALPFAQINCGGMTDEHAIRGFPYTYVGSQPGSIASAIMSMGCKNGVLFLDELEKISNKVSNSLLHIIDPSQNSRFKDQYFGPEIPIDLSQVWFIFSMNNKPSDSALSDRIFFIQMSKYTRKEKVVIVRNYSIPRICQEIGLSEIEFPEETCQYIVDRYSGDEPGMRGLDHVLRDMVRKIFFQRTNPNLKTSFFIPDTKKITIDTVNKLNPGKKEEKLSMYT